MGEEEEGGDGCVVGTIVIVGGVMGSPMMAPRSLPAGTDDDDGIVVGGGRGGIIPQSDECPGGGEMAATSRRLGRGMGRHLPPRARHGRRGGRGAGWRRRRQGRGRGR